MSTERIHPVVLSGGSGSRLWPLSRAGYPKQFLPLAGENSMLQGTMQRVAGSQFAAPLMICNDEHRYVVAEQLRTAGITANRIILEPIGRNTAPAVAVAALTLLEQQEDALMLVLPSDHVIQNEPAFHAAIAQAEKAARQGHLVTFGITPNKPETGYGYIQQAEELSVSGVHKVARFVEKPDFDTAATYVASGEFLWNSGIFLFSAKQYLDELKAHHPKMVKACQAALELAENDLTFCRLNKEAFANSPSDSIDYAVMEKTTHAAVVPVDMNWSDLGAWSALWDITEKDSDGNASHGDVLLHNTRNSYVHADHALVAVTGLDDVIVVATDDAVLVANRDNAQDVKKIVDTLKEQGRYEHTLHTTVHRPWGNYRGIDLGERYQVKRISVKPGEQLSLQKHYHRAEHWIVVKGTALVTCGEKEFLVRENESTYIPMGEVHRLKNPGKVELELIEVQSGGYLGEDDIVRLEDGYGRTQ
ncbi:mannose-1-phosphate guanylyltransferase/mannose-6-phosphate isomerase [Oceanimonas pelagia]|uniref:mannose-1-phosphate guanylyltransferase n=1 Tax=Oceanimonas pelagia TaxID=3028314 RepID=A0AA50KLF4_9GAMM|nr:mannose-1-phosphate guanylyltransferase/mannose-6-phosphate isomerase [Oceanimonas pelagia]WMC09216.1 mannose-1-phosphate guanylyltransferase/mannose-6-phosphate isomerase [Oceanimonas pelagia]